MLKKLILAAAAALIAVPAFAHDGHRHGHYRHHYKHHHHKHFRHYHYHHRPVVVMPPPRVYYAPPPAPVYYAPPPAVYRPAPVYSEPHGRVSIRLHFPL